MELSITHTVCYKFTGAIRTSTSTPTLLQAFARMRLGTFICLMCVGRGLLGLGFSCILDVLFFSYLLHWHFSSTPVGHKYIHNTLKSSIAYWMDMLFTSTALLLG